MTPKDFTPKAARLAAKEKRIHEWVIDFLASSGGNNNMVEGMQQRSNGKTIYWIGPLNFPLAELARCCGPEKDLEYPEKEKKWTGRLNKLRRAIKKGAQLPVIIVNPRPWPILSIRDGNHRYGALQLERKRKYWTLFYFDDKKDLQRFKRKYHISS
ncbi:MAG: hypothetical protein KBB55_02830 [Candidatus Buchananbacteria bacterium]|nr:hypothetical protein [Candidatus Buchananbacteria bacterium]